MSGFEKQTYTQVPNSLFEIMHDMDECELKVVLYICRYTFGYHREEVKISNRKLAAAIKMSLASVEKGADSAVARGLIERITEGQNTTLWRAIVAVSENDTPTESVSKIDTPVSQNLIQDVSKNESQVGVKERIKKEEKNKYFSILQKYAFIIWGPNDPTEWRTIRHRLKKDDVVLEGDEKKIIVRGMSTKQGNFTEAEIWTDRYCRYFSNLGLELIFTE